MKVMLHGAINMSNYGDFLFAELFGNTLKINDVEVEYYSHPKYGISDFYSKHLGYCPDRSHYKETVEKCDALVLISGGYFVEPLRKKYLSEFHHVQRYLKPAFSFLKNNKPIYILGVGAGPFTNASFSRKAKKIIDYAKVVTVRNEESKQHCIDYGINRDIQVTADTALLIGEYLESNKKEIPLFDTLNDKKMLLLHIDSNLEAKTRLKEVIIPAIKTFLNNHKEYDLYLTADGIKSEILYQEYSDMLKEYSPTVLIYDDPWRLTRQIQRADMIITTKLHVGIVGATLGRSVISFPFVPNKTKRFYKQIGEENRCVSLRDVDTNTALNLMEYYKDKTITIDKELIEKARINLSLLPK